jgi:hypothetical protein
MEKKCSKPPTSYIHKIQKLFVQVQHLSTSSMASYKNTMPLQIRPTADETAAVMSSTGFWKGSLGATVVM